MRENVKVNVIVEVEVKEEEFKETKKGERKKQGRKPPLLCGFAAMFRRRSRCGSGAASRPCSSGPRRSRLLRRRV